MLPYSFFSISDGSKHKGVVTEFEEETVPPELTCKVCKELVRDAVIIPCCAESFCDECELKDREKIHCKLIKRKERRF